MVGLVDFFKPVSLRVLALEPKKEKPPESAAWKFLDKHDEQKNKIDDCSVLSGLLPLQAATEHKQPVYRSPSVNSVPPCWVQRLKSVQSS